MPAHRTYSPGGTRASFSGKPTVQSFYLKMSDHTRLITDRLGNSLGRQVRQAQPPLVIRTYKCAQTEGCSSCSESPVTVCMPLTCTGTGSVKNGMGTAVLTESNPHSGCSKQGGRYSVQKGPSSRVVTHGGGNPNVGPMWDSPGRSFSVQGNNPLPIVFLYCERVPIGPASRS